MPPPWWGTRSNVSKRLRLEYEAMRAAFGSTFRLLVPEHSNEKLFWEGEVILNLAEVRWKKYTPVHTLKILYPDDYPNRPAEAYVLKPRIYSEKHQYEDGQLCLFNPKDGEHYGWNPSKSTAVTVGRLGNSVVVRLLHLARHRRSGPASRNGSIRIRRCRRAAAR